MNKRGDILKYKKYCIIHSCKKLASFNYHNEKIFLYCNEHKLDNMINIEKFMFYVKNIIFLILKIHTVKICEMLYCLLCKQMLINLITFLKNILIILIEILL